MVSPLQRLEGEKGKDLVSSLTQLKKRVQASRLSTIREKLKKNEKNLEAHTSHLYALTMSKSGLCMMEMDQNKSKNVLTLRLGNTLCDFDGTDSGFMEKDIVNSQEELLSSGILFGHSSKGKSLIRLIKLPIIEKIPPYTTWIFVDSSQERYEVLLRKYQERTKKAEFSGEAAPATKTFLDKTLSLALDSFDNLFCRRCLSEKLPFTFEPDENMKPCSEQCYLRRKEAKESETGVTLETESRKDVKESNTGAIMEVESFSLTETPVALPLETEDSDMHPVDEEAKLSVSNIRYNDSDRHIAVHKGGDSTLEGTTDSELLLKSMGKRKAQKHESMLVGTMKDSAEKILNSSDKKQKKLRISDVVSMVSKDMLNINLSDSKDPCALPEVQLQDKVLCELSTNDHKMDRFQRKDSNAGEDIADIVKEAPSVKSCKSRLSSKGQGSQDWSTIEKDLYLKGIEIFGKNRYYV
ncbi:hypothetical protein Taro_028162 [Colocasia esculenta]|uniref:Uncharacterized protein n=1 Tax=Colocasia esculenta TaxID=4460 RepID=A0A843VPM3_COLES|nr:hypothetical protein [Colocasia esculenta]